MFEMTGLQGSPVLDSITSAPEDQPIQPGGNPALWETGYNVTVNISNTGEYDGAAVPQLYVSFPHDTTPSGTPLRQLRWSGKVFLTKGEMQTVCFELMRRDLSYWDVVSQQWVIPEGEITLSAGWSSRDLQAVTTITAVSARFGMNSRDGVVAMF